MEEPSDQSMRPPIPTTHLCACHQRKHKDPMKIAMAMLEHNSCALPMGDKQVLSMLFRLLPIYHIASPLFILTWRLIGQNGRRN